jgi:hypothetical protein
MADENDSGSVNMTSKRRFADITNQQLDRLVEDKDALNSGLQPWSILFFCAP